MNYDKETIKKYFRDCNHRESGEDIAGDMRNLYKQLVQRKIDLMDWVNK